MILVSLDEISDGAIMWMDENGARCMLHALVKGEARFSQP